MLRLSEVMNLTDENRTYLVVDDEKKLLCDLTIIERDTYRNYVVTSIVSANEFVVLKLQQNKPPTADVGAGWVKEYKEQNGHEPSFF